MFHHKKYDLFFIIGLSFIILFLFSKNSWLYSTNDWVDANAFMTVGNAWSHGIIPYKDIFEQKGPILYLIYGFAAKTGLWFHGIFLLELGLMATSLWLLNKTFYMLSDNRFKINLSLFIYIIGFVFAPYFDRGGGVEELSSIAIIYLLYLATIVSKKNSLKTSQIFIAATLFSIIFWIKYTMILTYIVLVISYLIYLYLKKDYQQIITIIEINILILGSISILIILYFLSTNSLSSLINVYFIDNIFNYRGNVLRTKMSPIITWVLYFSKILIIFVPIILATIIKRKNKLISNKLIFILITIVLLNFFFSNNYLYYSLIVYPIIAYLLFITDLSKATLSIIAFVLAIYVFVNNISLNQTIFSTHQSPGQVVAKLSHHSKDVIQVGTMDSGIYNVVKQTPHDKYFQLNNIDPDTMPALITEPFRIIKSQNIKYVLTTKKIYDWKKSTLFSNYKVIHSFYPYESNHKIYYYLLELKGN